MVRRAAICLLQFAKIPENRHLLFVYQQRLLALVFSNILDQGVGAIVADVIYELSSHDDYQPQPLSNFNSTGNSTSWPASPSANESHEKSGLISTTSCNMDSPEVTPLDTSKSFEPIAAISNDEKAFQSYYKINGNDSSYDEPEKIIQEAHGKGSKKEESIFSSKIKSNHEQDDILEMRVGRTICNGGSIITSDEDTVMEGPNKFDAVNLNHSISSNLL